MLILGIETSCDETAAAVVRDGREVLSNVVATQFHVHERYGGVVPELACRFHIERLLPTVREALRTAGVGLREVDGIAVTQGPGLIGALLVGVSFAKAVAQACRIPLVGVHHLEAHLSALLLEEGALPYPFVALLVSGGHTHLFFAEGLGRYRLLGQTRDDAVGEAFDKVAKILGLGYPGGPIIDRLAQEGDPTAISFPRPFLEPESLDFSFSGLKTAVLYYVSGQRSAVSRQLSDIAASFQAAVVEVLVEKLSRAVRLTGVREVVVAGGVAANTSLRKGLVGMAEREGWRLHIPPISLCTDNGAMVAALGHAYFQGGRAAPTDLAPRAMLPMGGIS
ncbi:MAG: tRNA (adenosine(37)-N6)-threonylcarbamoyltransferase complex transferase subunit TsaD [Nitrospirae bacterium]|nr:tRNA (adenosine(37)-N6)-threonylcarbamoyltransferase complex transferase subunit TsaD [Nitrospirota bacterium]